MRATQSPEDLTTSTETAVPLPPQSQALSGSPRTLAEVEWLRVEAFGECDHLMARKRYWLKRELDRELWHGAVSIRQSTR